MRTYGSLEVEAADHVEHKHEENFGKRTIGVILCTSALLLTGVLSSNKYMQQSQVQATNVKLQTGHVTRDIVNGQNVGAISTYPFVVNTQRTANQAWCGGTLIDPYWVLSAAHCGVPGNGRVSAGRLTVDNGVYEIVERVEYPTYVQNAPGVNGAAGWEEFNDYVLFRLNTPVPVSTNAQPVPFLFGYQLGANTQGTIMGWGNQQSGGNPSNVLKEGNVRTTNACPGWAVIENNEVCLNGDAAIICNGDSGGPVAMSVQNKWGLYGVASQSNCNNEAVFSGTEFLTVNDNTNWMYKTIMKSHKYRMLPVTRLADDTCQIKDYLGRTSSVSCPDATTLMCGETRQGSITAYQQQTFTFSSGGVDIPLLIISTCSAGTTYDSKIWLKTSSGSALATKDDTGTCGHNSRHEFISFGQITSSSSPISLRNSYQVAVGGFSSQAGVFYVSAICSQGTISCGGSVSGSIGSNQKKMYTFGVTGNYNTVTVSTCNGGTNYNTVVMIFDADGTTLLGEYDNTNDNNGCGTANREYIRISPSTTSIFRNGHTYHIAVAGSGTASGNYQLSVNCA